MTNKIYYDPSDGFLWGPDEGGGKRKVRTDAVVALMPQNVSLSEDGCLLIDDLNNKTHTLLGPDGKPKSLIGPPGLDGAPGKDGHEVVCHYTAGEYWKSEQIIKDLAPGTYTIYGLVIAEADSAGRTVSYPFNSACILLGEFKDMTEDSLKEFGEEFTIEKPVNIYVAFVDAAHISAAKAVEDVEDGDEQLKHVEANCTITVKNIYLCAKGEEGETGETGPQGEAGQSVKIEGKSYVNGTTVIRFSDGTEIEITDGNKYVQTDASDHDLQYNYTQILDEFTQFAPGDFTISFDSGTIWAYTGLGLGFVPGPSLKGAEGRPGTNGKNGTNGEGFLLKGRVQDLMELEKGEAGDMYEVGDDGQLYIWSTAEDKWVDITGVIKGPKGDPGEPGADGENGENGITPQLEIVDGYWHISYDNKNSWTRLGKATGEDGQNGEDGADGVNGLTPFIGENGNWWIGTEDTGVQAEGKDGFTPEIIDGEWYIGGSNTHVQAEGKDGENPFTEEEIAALNALPEALNSEQSKNSQQFQSISEQIKEISTAINSTHGRIAALEERLAALEQSLSNIDLTSLAAAYPKPEPEPEPSFNMINSCVVKDEASYQNLPESYRSKHGEWGTPGLQESLPWLAVEFSPITANQLQIKVTGPNNFEKEISYPDIEKEVTLLTLNEEELQTELITGPWTININGAQTTLIVDRDAEE